MTTEKTGKKKWIVGIGLLLSVFAGIAWAAWQPSVDPQLAELQEMREKLDAKGEEKLPKAERRQLFREMRDKFEKLPPELQKQAFDAGRPQFQQFMEQRLDDFFALKPEQQKAELDKRIDEMEKRDKRRQERQAARKTAGNGATATQSASARPGGDRGDRSGWGGWGGRNMTDKQRQQMRKEMLNSTTPQMRAKFTEFRRMMDDRRKERGLPPGRGRW